MQFIRDCRKISIHAPREGGDLVWYVYPESCLSFQSTPPARGATFPAGLVLGNNYISIHAPREGGDLPTVSLSAGLI